MSEEFNFEFDKEDAILEDLNNIEMASKELSQEQMSTPIPNTPSGVVSAPPSKPKITEEEKENQKYKEEKNKLYKLKNELISLANSDTNGEIVRNFGMSQLVIYLDGDLLRLNGLIILRALKTKCKIRTQSKKSKDIQEQAGIKEELAQVMYEVWGEMEDGSLGLTSSYLPSLVSCVIDLNSGYDVSPDV